MANKKEDHAGLIDSGSSDSNLIEELKKHPGFGKPLPSHIFSGDIYSNFVNTARDAGYLPPFVELQRQIRQKIEVVRVLIKENPNESKVNRLIDEINENIKKYNGICPSPMQRGLISLESIENQYKIWE